nr:hypothetical protein [Moraxella sp. CTOTU46711]
MKKLVLCLVYSLLAIHSHAEVNSTWDEEKYYISENDSKGVNNDEQMEKALIKAAKSYAPYHLCGDYNGSGDLNNTSYYYYNLVTTEYDRKLINKYGSRENVANALYDKLDRLVKDEKQRLVHNGIGRDMCKKLEGLEREY